MQKLCEKVFTNNCDFINGQFLKKNSFCDGKRNVFLKIDTTGFI